MGIYINRSFLYFLCMVDFVYYHLIQLKFDKNEIKNQVIHFKPKNNKKSFLPFLWIVDQSQKMKKQEKVKTMIFLIGKQLTLLLKIQKSEFHIIFSGYLSHFLGYYPHFIDFFPKKKVKNSVFLILCKIKS